MAERLVAEQDGLPVGHRQVPVVDRLVEPERPARRHEQHGVDRRGRADRAHHGDLGRVHQRCTAQRERPVHTGQAARVGDATDRSDLGRVCRPAVRLTGHGHVPAGVGQHQRLDRGGIGERRHVQAGHRVAGAGRVGRDRGSHPLLVLLGQPDPEVQPERSGHLVPEVRAERAAAHPPDHLADQEAEGQPVVAVTGTRTPERFLTSQRVDHELPVVEAAGRQGFPDGRQPRLVAQQVADQDAVLAVLGELRPVRRDRSIDIELAARREQVRAQRHRALGGRPYVADRVLGPWLVRPGGPAPQIDHCLSVERHAHRRPDLAGLLTAVGRVPAAGLVAAVVSGEAGIGKSHLIGAAAERLAAKAWPVLRVRADRLERQVPYAALAAALRTLASDNSFTEGVRRDAVAALDLPLGTPDPPGTAFGRACARVTRLLTALTAASPLVVVVDDLHELDDDSLALLSVVLPRLSSAPIGFVVALRSHLAEPNAAAQELLDRLADTVERVRVELGTLPAADIGAMIVPLLGAPPDDDLIGEVHRRCDGNPYFAVEIAHSLVEAGVVTVDGSLARLAVAPRSVPLTRRTAVLRRVLPLSPDARAVARTLAVFRKVGLERIALLARVAGLSEAAVAAAFDDLVRAHVVVREAGQGYRFSHDIIADALYDEIGPAQCRHVHGLVAQGLRAQRRTSRRDPWRSGASGAERRAGGGGQLLRPRPGAAWRGSGAAPGSAGVAVPGTGARLAASGGRGARAGGAGEAGGRRGAAAYRYGRARQPVRAGPDRRGDRGRERADTRRPRTRRAARPAGGVAGLRRPYGRSRRRGPRRPGCPARIAGRGGDGLRAARDPDLDAVPPRRNRRVRRPRVAQRGHLDDPAAAGTRGGCVDQGAGRPRATGSQVPAPCRRADHGWPAALPRRARRGPRGAGLAGRPMGQRAGTHANAGRRA